MISNLEALVASVMAEATHPNSSIHGPMHWRIVSKNGIDLAAITTGADAEVAFLFGLFHDAKRESDGYDPEHGPRAAKLVERLHGRDFQLSSAMLEKLVYACATHTSAGPTPDPVVGLCYDADRLDLWRVNVGPRPEFMSTQAARDPERILASRSRRLEASWDDLYRQIAEK